MDVGEDADIRLPKPEPHQFILKGTVCVLICPTEGFILIDVLREKMEASTRDFANCVTIILRHTCVTSYIGACASV